MSILVKPYTISVWDDVWENGQFVEKRLGIIGSDRMVAQCRVIEPSLTRNINGSKKLTFKMYHKYVDTITGEEVINPFSKWMISERKVKLYYEDKWYDFVIKNIVENSSTHLYTYQLEDAIVMELSKNGFNTILDAELQNNMGNAKTLAEFILSETDWVVESEKFVEQVEENLVYATITKNELPKYGDDTYGFIPYRLEDANEDSLKSQGIIETEVSWDDFFGDKLTKEVLVFYSSCKNRPRRFQFICLDDYDRKKVKIDKNNRTIQEKDCQYYIELWPDDYKTEDTDGFIMPEGFTTSGKTYSDADETDGTISVWYKGNRYGYAQQAIYSPQLKRYINLYKDSNNIDYYGYLDNQYMSPTIVKNLVSNTSFTSTSGWIGASTTGTSSDKATIENVYGRFDRDGTFISSIDDLKNGITNKYDEYDAYMRITLPTDNSIVFNDGIYDNRKSIGNMEENSEWAFRIVCHDPIIPSVDFGEYDYSDGAYVKIDSPLFSIEPTNVMGEYTIYTIGSHYESANTFAENSHIRIALSGQGTYYIKEMEFFSAHYNKNEALITPNNQGDIIDEGVIIPTYYYFSKADHDAATSLDDLKNITKSENGLIKDYLPVFNERAEKVRAVSVKESNHFNNLQSIAETFDCQIDFEITHDAFGGINSKKVKLKNYAGKDNHACFRYGVNLKDIQRTYESKNITTKLIVKQNNNELGEDGFCTIQRAGANPTGESYIYDFQYYQNIGLMSADQYIDVLYKMSHNFGTEEEPINVIASGPDIDDVVVTEDSKCNIQGYFPRLRNLNNKIINENKLVFGIVNDLREKNTQLKIAETALSAANEGEIEVSEDFYKLTGFYPQNIGNMSIAKSLLCSFENMGDEDSVHIWNPTVIFYDSKEDARNNNGAYCVDKDDLDLFKFFDDEHELNGLNLYSNRLSFGACYKTPNIVNKKTINIYFYPKIYFGTNDDSKTIETIITLEFSPDIKTSDGYSYCLRTKYFLLMAEDNQNVQNYLIQYNTYKQEASEQAALVETLSPQVTTLTSQYEGYVANIDKWTKQKALLNKEFYKKYSRFIQEGTWIGEEYVDDDKYYADALSVIYNSCYPKVAYAINVVTLSSLPGYENFVFNVGDKTYVVDPEFFGDELQEEVIITEMSNMLDDPSKDTIKVQNFKNQFQDLFQKITATSQQVQYNAGSYERGSALAQAISDNSIEFLTQTLDEMTVNLSDPDLESSSTDGSSSIKIVDGKILLGKKKEDGKHEWTIGLSSAGISANKITAGSIDTGVIQIMNGTDPAFRWDAFGISAFGNEEYEGVVIGTDTKKFVRFDKYGIYGIDGKVDGLSWHAGNENDIDDKATFALTWQGLKITGNAGVEARIGKIDNNIINITKGGKSIFRVGNDGNSEIAGWTIEPSQFSYPAQYKANGTINRYGAGIKATGQNQFAIWVGFSDTTYKTKDPYEYVSLQKPADATNVYDLTNFVVTGTGILHAKGANIAGTITAQGGSIGSWNIGTIQPNTEKPWGSAQYTNSIYYVTGNGTGTAYDYLAFLRMPESDTGHVFSVRKKKNGVIEYPFSVSKNGALSATNATIEGDVTATSGRIGCWFIEDDGLYSTEEDIGTQSAYIIMQPTGYTAFSDYQKTMVTSGGLIFYGYNHYDDSTVQSCWGGNNFITTQIDSNTITANFSGRGIGFSLNKYAPTTSLRAEYDETLNRILLYIYYNKTKYYFNASGNLGSFTTSKPTT